MCHYIPGRAWHALICAEGGSLGAAGPVTSGRITTIVAGGWKLAIGGRWGASAEPGAAPGGKPRRVAPPSLAQLGLFGPPLIGRAAEVADVARRAQPGSFTVVGGEAGIGTTSVLLAAGGDAGARFADGVVYVAGGGRTPSQLLRAIWDCHYRPGENAVPEAGEMVEQLRSAASLILIDDCDDVDAFRNQFGGAFSRSAVIAVGTTTSRADVHLQGLAPADASALWDRELAQPVARRDRAAVRDLLELLGHHPGRIVQAASLARVAGMPVSRIIRLVNHAGTPADELLRTLTGEQRATLIALAISSPDGLTAHGIAAAAECTADHAATLAESLRSAGLATRLGERYVIHVSALERAELVLDAAEEWQANLDRLAVFVDALKGDPAAIIREVSGALGMSGWAERAEAWHALALITRVTKDAFAVSGHWQEWQQTLEWLLTAARASGDAMEEALALHEMGVLTMVNGDAAQAESLLSEAAHLRRAAGAEDGERASEQMAREARALRSRGPVGPRWTARRRGRLGGLNNALAVTTMAVVFTAAGFGAAQLAPASSTDATQTVHVTQTLPGSVVTTTETVTDVRTSTATETVTEPGAAVPPAVPALITAPMLEPGELQPGSSIGVQFPGEAVVRTASLTALQGRWEGAGSVTDTWVSCNKDGCADVVDGESYTVQNDDVGHELFVRETATNVAGTASASSRSPGIVVVTIPS